MAFKRIKNFLNRNVRGSLFGLIYPAKFYNYKNDLYYKAQRNELRGTQHTVIANFSLQGEMRIGEITQQQRQESDITSYIDATFFTNGSALYEPSKQYVIMLGGNGTYYELFSSEMAKMADEQVTVIGFNPMGIGTSTGLTNGPEDYHASIMAIIENLHANGIPYDHIVLQGHSLGGGIGLEVAEKYQRTDRRVRAIADRTFGRLDNEAGFLIGDIFGTVISFIPKLLLRKKVASVIKSITSTLVYYPVKFLINVFGLNINATDAFNFINKKHPGDAVGFSVNHDEVIFKECNLYNSVNADYRDKGYVKLGTQFGSANAHNCDIEDIRFDDIRLGRPATTGADLIAQAKDNFRTDILPLSPNIQPHSDDMTVLVSRPEVPIVSAYENIQKQIRFPERKKQDIGAAAAQKCVIS
jgi:pimeloyl-ACP methyl ester carboxylesterase